MPELPEVEIVKQTLDKKVKLKKINKVIIKNRNLRFKIPLEFEDFFKNKVVKNVNLRETPFKNKRYFPASKKEVVKRVV